MRPQQKPKHDSKHSTYFLFLFNFSSWFFFASNCFADKHWEIRNNFFLRQQLDQQPLHLLQFQGERLRVDIKKTEDPDVPELQVTVPS